MANISRRKTDSLLITLNQQGYRLHRRNADTLESLRRTPTPEGKYSLISGHTPEHQSGPPTDKGMYFI